jgi:hypothetical protein
MFNSQFIKRLTTYHATLSTSNNTKQVIKLSNDEVVQLYLARLVTTMPHTRSVYSRIRDEYVKVQPQVDNNTPVNTSITELTQQLQSLEALELKQPPSETAKRLMNTKICTKVKQQTPQHEIQ